MRDTVARWNYMVASCRDLLEIANLAEAEEDTSLHDELAADVASLKHQIFQVEAYLTLTGPYDERRNKKGDVVITLGPTHIAAGAKIVVEAKQRDKYTLTEALAEIREARENREAGVGIFVFSASRAPEDLDPLRHYGDDIVVVWDAEDPGSDVFLDAALSVAKALCNRPKGDGNGETSTDLKAVEEAIGQIEKDAGRLDKIIKSVGTIERQTKSIRTEAQKLQETIGKNTARLKDKIAGLSGTEPDDEDEAEE